MGHGRPGPAPQTAKREQFTQLIAGFLLAKGTAGQYLVDDPVTGIKPSLGGAGDLVRVHDGEHPRWSPTSPSRPPPMSGTRGRGGSLWRRHDGVHCEPNPHSRRGKAGPRGPTTRPRSVPSRQSEARSACVRQPHRHFLLTAGNGTRKATEAGSPCSPVTSPPRVRRVPSPMVAPSTGGDHGGLENGFQCGTVSAGGSLARNGIGRQIGDRAAGGIRHRWCGLGRRRGLRRRGLLITAASGKGEDEASSDEHAFHEWLQICGKTTGSIRAGVFFRGEPA